jgi:hypothetical protein
MSFPLFFFFYFWGGSRYCISSGAFVTGVLDMRAFIVGNELVGHAFVNIPFDEKMHMGVCRDWFVICIVQYILCYLCLTHMYLYVCIII